MTNRDIASIGFCSLLLGAGCVMDDAEPQGRSGVPWKASAPIRTLMERDGLEPLLRDLVKQPANPQGATSSTVAVPAKVPRQDERQASQANATLRQDGYTFRTNHAGEAMILEFEKGYSGSLAITNVLGGCRVTGIGIRAFQNCAGLTDIVIPSRVTSIGEAAFEFCHGLTRVSVPATVTSMGGNPFGGCHRLLSVSVEAANPAYTSNGDGILFTKDGTELICYPAGKAGDYVIPDGVTRLGRGAFLFCPQLTRVVMPNSVTTIGDCVFFICPRLTHVTLSESVTRIGMQAFESCNGLTELTIPASVTHLVSWAFRGSGNLTSIYFKGDAPGGGADTSVLSGADKATVYYRPGTKGWGETFGGRPAKVWKDAGTVAPTAHSPQPTAALPETSIHDFACVAEGSGVAIAKYTGEGGTVVIPAKVSGLPVTTIRDSAFRDCVRLEETVIPEGVVQIGDWAFAGCCRLTKVALPNTVTNINPHAFRNCSALTSLYLGDRLASIGNEAFRACTSLTEITIPARVVRIGWAAFADCTRLGVLRVDPLNTAYGSTPDGVLLTKDSTRLVAYPAGRIGPYIIPKGVTHIGEWSFYTSTQLSGVTIPEGVLTIEGHAFNGCTNLTALSIPASVSGLCGNMIYNCSRLERLSVDERNPTYWSDADGVVFTKDKTRLICYPRGRHGDYDIPTGVTRVEFCSFECSPWLTGVGIPDSVTSISGWSFPSCQSLTRVTIPSGVKEIEHCTFYNCEKLQSVYFMGDAPKLHPEWWWSFGGNPTIYHRLGTKGWNKELAGKPTAVWIPEAEGKATNLVCETFIVSEAEKRGEWQAALTEYENAYDATKVDEPMRSILRKKFAELRPKVPSNRDPAKGGIWKVKAYAFREVAFGWTDAEKKPHYARWIMSDLEVTAIRTALAAFAERVWENTSGCLAIDWMLEVVDAPLTKLDGQDRFWPAPWACVPALQGLDYGAADTVMVYAKFQGDGHTAGVPIPAASPVKTIGVENGTQGATYIGFCVGGDTGTGLELGERELQAWLNAVRWTLEEYQGYPYGLMASPDGGREEGEAGGDYCYRRKPGEKGPAGYHRHLMREHVTRRMWRELSVRNKPDNIWIEDFEVNQYARRAIVLGPFAADGKPDGGIDVAFIDETRCVPKLGEKIGDVEWCPLFTQSGKIFDLGNNTSGRSRVEYLAFNFQSDREQKALVKIGSDNHSRLWQDGKPILSLTNNWGIVIDQSSVAVNLKQGENRFLFKVADWGGAWQASFRLCAPDGHVLSGVRQLK